MISQEGEIIESRLVALVSYLDWLSFHSLQVDPILARKYLAKRSSEIGWPSSRIRSRT